ncbi:putative int1 protein bud site selection protein bud4 [Erysiphe neolycopersici]|uniref:Putative int1 protein bud site selection protein bud4 n=1 Tax=Erysiphe neolycopersici TaxID=212602 RepID=A0A420HGZ3_9PEZI|nr:putative int1 protein bud site selection protein bud4 [Erysiphe neolycopersici]
MESTSSRALLELSSISSKQNSPIMTKPKNNMFNNPDSSPFQSSPLTISVDGKSSPRLFWQGREHVTPSRLNTENIFNGRESSPSPTRRTSIEKLQRASRVKNSNMFAREQKLEYDPTSVPILERPLSKTLQGNAYNGLGLNGYRHNENTYSPGYKKNDFKGSPSKIPQLGIDSNLAKRIHKLGLNTSKIPGKEHQSPIKSSLSTGRTKSSFSLGSGSRSEDQSVEEKKLPPGRALHRHTKSVTFDAAPPQINEYEMATPDISSIGTESRENSYDSAEDEYNHFNCDDSMEQENSFDASLEDLAKTPVVGPEDWRNESPNDHVRKFMEGEIDDPFDELKDDPFRDSKSPILTAWSRRSNTTLSNSSGEQRPLPPIPRGLRLDKLNKQTSAPETSNKSGESRGKWRHQVNSPTKAATKADLQGITGGNMTLEERLNLMMTHDEESPSNQAENQRERRMRRAITKDQRSQTPDQKQTPEISQEDNHTLDFPSSIESFQLPHRISRESILRKVEGQLSLSDDTDYIFSSPTLHSSLDHRVFLDPDIPIPTTETDFDVDETEDLDTASTIAKQETEDNSDLTTSDIPELSVEASQERQQDNDDRLRYATQETESQYSEDIPITDATHESSKFIREESSKTDSSVIATPMTATDANLTGINEPSIEVQDSGLDIHKFRLSLQIEPLCVDPDSDVESKRNSKLETHSPLPLLGETYSEVRPSSTPENDGVSCSSEEDYESKEGTPESVIHHEIFVPSPCESPSIPDKIATIKSSSGSYKLKTRPSATSADLEEMRENRENDNDEIPSVPPIPDRHRNRPMSVDRGMMQKFGEAFDGQLGFKRSLTLDIGNDLSLNLDNDFDRVIQAQKRGYLMRQNTKIVVATSDTGLNDKFNDLNSNDNSPVKHNRTRSWVVEPWNGQTRKNSGVLNGVRNRNISTTSNRNQGASRSFSGASGVSEISMLEDGNERGRLFVKVLGVKDLNLPLPRNEKTWFNLTLDNGVHCVTTAWLELGKNAPIGQEFELIVPNDLEFQLTLNAKLVKPIPKKINESPSKSFKVHKPSTFSRVFTSPRKRKELEARQRDEEQQYAKQRELESKIKKSSTEPTAWDLLSPFTSENGSFARSYVCLKDHESSCFGRPYVAEVSCFNEWATEQVNKPSSVMSKRSSSYVQRRAPYKVANLELQLLFVPKPKGATDDDMPKSMNSCIREMREVEKALALQWEGHLSQQGGDCPYWRRRYFKLAGSKLTAYHESTRQPRVTINLGNACKLIDDRSILTQKETTGRGGKRRKSGFAEEEEGYMFVEEGFRIRFNNGEVIDFYADSPADKEAWMRALDGCIGKEGDSGKKSWCNLVLKREQSYRRRAEKQ